MQDIEFKAIEAEVADLAQLVEDGLIDPLKAYVYATQLKQTCEVVCKQIKDEAIREAEKHGKRCEVYGAKIEVRNLPDRPKFEQDPVFANFDNLTKQRKKLLTQAVKSKHQLTDENGELIPKVDVAPGSMTIAVTLPKF